MGILCMNREFELKHSSSSSSLSLLLYQYMHLSKYNVGQRIFKASPVIVLAQESMVVMIVQKSSQNSGIRKHFLILHPIMDVSHCLLESEGIIQPVIHCVVQ